jgi:hypothetical protein
MTMTTKAEKEQLKTEAISYLRKILKPGTTVYTVLRHVSASGMSRRIDLYAIRNNKPVCLTGYVSHILGLKRHHREDGLVVGGCGMDMGFHVVYSLSYSLFPKGFIPAKANPPRHGRNGSDPNELDQDGGYALNHEWL